MFDVKSESATLINIVTLVMNQITENYDFILITEILFVTV